jgi:hypothetical protein
MTRMTRQDFFRSVGHGQGLLALFVDLKPSCVRDEKLIAQYTVFARCGAVAILAVLIACVFVLVKTGHPWAGLVLVGFGIFATVMQLLEHKL